MQDVLLLDTTGQDKTKAAFKKKSVSNVAK